MKDKRKGGKLPVAIFYYIGKVRRFASRPGLPRILAKARMPVRSTDNSQQKQKSAVEDAFTALFLMNNELPLPGGGNSLTWRSLRGKITMR